MRTTAKVAVLLSRRVRWCRPKKRKEELLLFSRLASPRRWKTGLLALTPSSRGWSKLFRVSPKKKRSLASFRPLYDGWCPALALHVHHHTAEGGLAGVPTTTISVGSQNHAQPAAAVALERWREKNPKSWRAPKGWCVAPSVSAWRWPCLVQSLWFTWRVRIDFKSKP